jgi:hypothetical protein
MDNCTYFKTFLNSVESVSVKWNFDEAQADPFHGQFNSKEFLSRLAELAKKPTNQQEQAGLMLNRKNGEFELIDKHIYCEEI